MPSVGRRTFWPPTRRRMRSPECGWPTSKLRGGNQKAALEDFRQVVAADPGNAEALNNLAYLLAEYGNQPAEALQYAQKAKELAPENAAYSDTLGWILYRKGLYTLAVAELERAAATAGNPKWKYHLAMAYAKAARSQPRPRYPAIRGKRKSEPARSKGCSGNAQDG